MNLDLLKLDVNSVQIVFVTDRPNDYSSDVARRFRSPFTCLVGLISIFKIAFLTFLRKVRTGKCCRHRWSNPVECCMPEFVILL